MSVAADANNKLNPNMTINPPSSKLTVGTWTSPDLNWEISGNMDAWTASGSGFPISKYASSEDAEMDVWEWNGIKADIYNDGTFEVASKIH